MEAKRKLKNKTEIKEAKIGEAMKQLNEKIENKLNFSIKGVNTIYIDYNMICLSFDTYQSEDNYCEIDIFQFLEFFNTDFLKQVKLKAINYINEK